VPRDGTIAGGVAASGESERIGQLQERGGHGLEAVADEPEPALVVPLGFRERGRGVLVALGAHGARAFDADQERLLTSFGASAAIAIAAAESAEAERLKLSVRASESERRRWARELHDETLQELGALNLMLQAAQANGQPEALESAVQKALEQLELSIASLQSLITELRPASLDELGVHPALEALAKRTSAYFGVAVETELDFAFAQGRAATRLTEDVESTTFRIVQEAITNAVKHADAGTISVKVAETEEKVVISVRDDGSGFDPDSRTNGFGLLGMRERVEMVDGRLLIESEPGRGTLVRAELPALRRAPADDVSELLS
jgi:signal transduction histidine kinase